MVRRVRRQKQGVKSKQKPIRVSVKISELKKSDLTRLGIGNALATSFLRLAAIAEGPRSRTYAARFRRAARPFMRSMSRASRREQRSVTELILATDVMARAAANGCGPEGFGWLVPDFCFEKCCDEHDQCYETGGCECDRLACDDTFLECMKDAGPDWLADLYYGAVRRFGQGSFNYHS